MMATPPRTPYCIVVLAALILGSCGMFGDEGDAESVAKAMFEAIKTKGYEQALEFYSPAFFERTPRDRWPSTLRTMNDKLGDLQAYELINSGVRYNFGFPKTGTLYHLQYKVTYSKFPATESFTLFRGITGGKVSIIGHFINSEGFMKN